MNSHVSPYRGFRGIAARHPIATLVVVGVALAYALTSVWGLAYNGYLPGGNLHEFLHIAPDEVTGLLLVLALFPTALFVTWAGHGRDGVTRLFRRMLRWRVHAGWWITVLLALPVLTTGVTLLFGAQLQPVDPVPFLLTQVGLMAANFVLVNFWEEAVWAGVFQTRLERGHNIFGVAVLSAIPFAAVHVPLEFVNGSEVTALGLLVAFLTYFVLSAFVRPLLATILRGTGDSLLLVALTHSVFNRTNNQNGIVATLTGSPEFALLAMPIAVVILFAITAIVVRRRLSRGYRRELDARGVGAVPESTGSRLPVHSA